MDFLEEREDDKDEEVKRRGDRLNKGLLNERLGE